MTEETCIHDEQSVAPGFPGLAIFAVVVLYKMLPAESPSVRSLMNAAHKASPADIRLHVRIVDNTPGGQQHGPLPPGVEYVAEPDNPGLSRPYNDARREAARRGYPWLLTLDQDTELPESYFVDLQQVARQYASLDRVGAIVPCIVDSGRRISPVRFLGGFLPVVVPASTGGVLGRHALAVNSAALLKVSALEAVGGYSEAFPLHNSDTFLFQKLDQAGMHVVLAGDIVISHQLAIMDRDNRMSGSRYRAMLADERLFWDLHMGPLGRMERLLRLMGRVAKDVLRGKRGESTGITLEEIRFRLFHSRKQRLRQAALRLHP